MIYDSEQEKTFILEAVKKYPTNYETALQLANSFGMSIQNGQVIDPQKQLEAFPPPGSPDSQESTPGTNQGAGSNGNRKTRRAAKKAPSPEVN